MRKVLLAGLVATASLTAMSGAASAFGDVCYPAIRDEGEGRSLHAAMHDAIDSWRHAVKHKYGAKYANWWYSGDRNIDCTWNATATHFRCAARATPCGKAY